ncbi:MAG: deoxynucleoside kinase [Anaerolineales bacterium]
MRHFVAVAGNIGVGKSTLVGLLADRMQWTPFYEPQAQNPYLADFYQDMQEWSFQSQIFFLSRRLRAHREISEHSGSVVQDRSVYEDAEVFANNLFLERNMSDRDYRTYRDLYEVLTRFLPPPDLVVYLRASVDTLMARISMRGRDYEKGISRDYLTRLNELYEDWTEHFSLCPVLTVPADDLNYVLHDEHLDLIVSKIQSKLSGKEEVSFEAEEIHGT